MFAGANARKPIYADQQTAPLENTFQEHGRLLGGPVTNNNDMEMSPIVPDRRQAHSYRKPKSWSSSFRNSNNDSPLARQEEGLDKWKRTQNWDRLFQSIYRYYTGRGIYCILLTRVFNLLTMAFALSFATFLFNCIDHTNLSKKRSLSDAMLPHCFDNITWFQSTMIFLFVCYWLWDMFDLVVNIRPLTEIYTIFTELLKISDHQLQTVTWAEVVDRLIELHSKVQEQQTLASNLQPNVRLNAHDIINRIMRKENYLIAIFNKDILDLSLQIPFPFPLAVINSGTCSLTKVLEWNLQYIIGNYVFGETDQGKELAVKSTFLRADSLNRSDLIAGLQRRFKIMGVLSLLLSPFIFVFLIVYFFFKYGKEIHHNPASLSARTYTPLARWKFREFNELPHLFQQRLNASYAAAGRYMNQFPQEKLAIIARFVAFVSGSLALSLTILSILDDNILLEFQITPGRSVLWYLGLFGIIWTGARSLVPDSHDVPEPEPILREVIKHTHYLPPEWYQYGLHSDRVQEDFGRLFELRILHFMHEMFAVILAPFVLCFTLPKCAERIVDFFREFTIHVDSVGWVCSFAVFDFRKFARAELSSPPTPSSASRPGITDSKMEQSLMDFKRNYPSWEPNDERTNAELQEMLQKAKELQQKEKSQKN